MTSINRRTFADLGNLGSIDVERGSDPIAVLIKELGITDADLESIGDGNSVIRGEKEFAQLFDRLAAKKGGASGLSRAEKVYQAYRKDRGTPRAERFATLDTKAEFDRASSEAQTRNAMRALDRIDISSERAPDAANKDEFVAWAHHEAARMDNMTSEVGSRQHELELLVGYRARGGERLGYYDRLIADAKKYIASKQTLADKGDAAAKAAVERGERVIKWAEVERSEARGVFREFSARATSSAGWMDEASHSLKSSAEVVAHNAHTFDQHRSAKEAYRNGIEQAKTEGKVPAELLDSKPWIALHQETQQKLDVTVELHQQLLHRADGDPTFAAWLETSGLLGTLEKQEQQLLMQLSEISDVVRGQKTAQIGGQTGVALGKASESIALVEQAAAALVKEDDRRLEKYERELNTKLSDVNDEIKRLKKEKARLEPLAKTPQKDITSSEKLFEVRTARMTLAGVVPDRKERPISLDRQIAALEESAKALRMMRAEVDGRHEYLKEVSSTLATRYGLFVETGETPLDVIAKVQKLAPIPGFEAKGDVLTLKVGDKTFTAGPKSSYGAQRRLLDEYAKLAHTEQAKAYTVMRAGLLQIGISYSDLDKLGFKQESVDQLPRMMAFFNNVVGRPDDKNAEVIAWARAPKGVPPGMVAPALQPEDATLLAGQVKGTGGKLTRQELLQLVEKGRTALGPRALEFARVMLVSKELNEQLGADKNGDISLDALQRFGSESALIGGYFERKTNIAEAKKSEWVKIVEKTVKADPPPVSPEYFPGAAKMVDELDPKLHPWTGADNPLFEKLRGLNQGQRAYVIALFEAKYSDKYGDDYLSESLKKMNVGESYAYMRLINGKTAKEASADFAKDFLATDNVEAFIQHHNAGQYYIEKADARKGFDLPKNLVDAHDLRLRKMLELNERRTALKAEQTQLWEVHNKAVDTKNPDPATDKRLTAIHHELASIEGEMKVHAGEMTIMGEALIDSFNAEVTQHNAEVERTRSMFKKIAVAAAATVAAYLTAGALAPEAGVLWAGVGAAIIGTEAGMATAFVIDVAEQAHDHGFSNVSLKKAGWAALDAAPEAFAAALSTGFLTAAVAARAGLLYKTIDGARAISVMGVTVKPAEFALKAGTIAGYSAATNLVGNVATAAYLHHVKGKEAEAAKILANAPRDALFAGASAALLMPLSRFSGMTGMTVDAGGNALQQIAYNKLSGRAWDDELASSVVMGAALGKIFETHRNIQAARNLQAAGAVGAEVRLPGDKTGTTWKIHSINERGFAVVSAGEPPIKQKVIASALAEANPHLNQTKAKKKPETGASATFDPNQAISFFSPGSGVELKGFKPGDVAYSNVSVAKDGTLVGSRPLSKKKETLKNADGTAMTALDVAKASPSSVLPVGLKVVDPTTGHTLTINDVRGWADPKLLVEARNANGKLVGYAELTPAELVARGVELDGKAMFDAKAVEAAQREVPTERFTSFTKDAPVANATDVGPPLNGVGTEPRVLTLEMEQRAQKLVGKALQEELGGRIDTKVRASQNADGTISLDVRMRQIGSNDAAAQMTLTFDPKKQTVKVDDLRVAEALKKSGIADKLQAVQSDFLSNHFAGWTLGKTKIPTSEARVEKIADAHGWDRTRVLGADPDTGKVVIEEKGAKKELSMADVLKQHPEIAVGLELAHDKKRVRIVGFDEKRGFELEGGGRLSAEDVVKSASHAIEKLISPPAVRVREPTTINGDLVMRDVQGYSLMGVDQKNGVAHLRNADGQLETRPLDRVVYEHSGIAPGSLDPNQHARYQVRLDALQGSDLTDWAHLRAAAADISHEHAAIADRMFALDYPLSEIDSLIASVRNVPQAEVGVIFSGKGITQDFNTSCAAAACLYGMAIADPKLAKLFHDNPDLAAWWQANILERNGSGVQPRYDADHNGRTQAAGLTGTPLEPVRTTSAGVSFFTGGELHPSLSKRALNDPAVYQNREAILVLGDAPQEIVKIYGDSKGNVFLESPMGGKAKKVKLPLFDEMKVGDRNVLAFKHQGKLVRVDELGLPQGATPPARESGFTHVRDAELIHMIEARVGERYLVRNPDAFSEKQFFQAIDWSLDNKHPVGLGVEWINPKTKKSLDASHQLWIAEKRIKDGKEQYLVYDPHFDEPRWMAKKQLREYTPFQGMVGKPMHLLVPDYLPLPGGGIAAGGVPTSGKTTGSVIHTPPEQIATKAKDVIREQQALRRRGSADFDPDVQREGLLAMALYDDAQSGTNVPQLTEFQKKFYRGRDVIGELDVQTEAVLFEVTNGKGGDKLEQLHERLAPGKVANPSGLPVVMLGSKNLDPDVRKALDAQGVLVLDDVAQAVSINRLYQSDRPLLERLYGLHGAKRKQVLGELLAAPTAARRAEIAAANGIDGGVVAVHNRSGAELAADRGWTNGLSADQVAAVEALVKDPDRTRVTVVRNDDGSIRVGVRTRLPRSNTWREQTGHLDAQGQQIR